MQQTAAVCHQPQAKSSLLPWHEDACTPPDTHCANPAHQLISRRQHRLSPNAGHLANCPCSAQQVGPQPAGAIATWPAGAHGASQERSITRATACPARDAVAQRGCRRASGLTQRTPGHDFAAPRAARVIAVFSRANWTPHEGIGRTLLTASSTPPAGSGDTRPAAPHNHIAAHSALAPKVHR